MEIKWPTPSRVLVTPARQQDRVELRLEQIEAGVNGECVEHNGEQATREERRRNFTFEHVICENKHNFNK